MEVMSASYAIATPQATTRPAPNPADYLYLAPASQESVASGNSSTSSHGQMTLDSSGSNVSQLTNVTDMSSISTAFSRPHRPERIQTHPDRARTPEEQPQSAMSLTSPMSITSPIATNGAKRTASGHVKNASSYSSTPLKAAFSPRRARAESMSSTGSRAGELAASLKMRLGYAMAKVQNGWETKTIAEIGDIASRTPPQRCSISSMQSLQRPTTAGYVDANGHQIRGQSEYMLSPPSKRRSGTFGVLTGGPEYAAYSASVPHLEPSVDIRSGNARQPLIKHTHSSAAHSHAMSPPRTPMNHRGTHRPPVLRTDTQTAEAERDALQALTQLGSPRNPQHPRYHDTSQASSSQASPQRSEFAPLHRVAFSRGDSDSSVMASGSDTSELRINAETHH